MTDTTTKTTNPPIYLERNKQPPRAERRIDTPYRLAKNNLGPDGFSPTMRLIWEDIDGDINVGQIIPVSVNKLVTKYRKSRPVIVKALLTLASRGYLLDTSNDPSSNKPHLYKVLRARPGSEPSGDTGNGRSGQR